MLNKDQVHVPCTTITTMMNPNKDNVTAPSTTYRTAMALNNLGVSMMMQGGPLHQAIRIFKDSFACMSSEKQHIPGGGGELGDTYLPVSKEQELSSASNQMVQAINVSYHPFEICPCDDSDVSFQTSTLFCVSKVVPIHLRSQHFYDQQEGSNENVNLALGIIMYNNALANLLAHVQDMRHTCSSRSFGSPPTLQHDGRNKFLRGAAVALNCSQAMIDRHLNDIDKDVNGGQKFEKLGGLVISAMALKTMMWVSRLDNQDQEGEQLGAKLLHVLADIDRYQNQLRKLNFNTCQNPASSAA